MGDSQTLRVLRRKAASVFGERSSAVAFLDDKIAIGEPDLIFETDEAEIWPLLVSLDEADLIIRNASS